jgi:hypothetical protein
MSYTTLEFRVAHATKVAACEVITAIKEKDTSTDEKIKCLMLMLNVLENPEFDFLMQMCFNLIQGYKNLETWETDLINEIDKLCRVI